MDNENEESQGTKKRKLPQWLSQSEPQNPEKRKKNENKQKENSLENNQHNEEISLGESLCIQAGDESTQDLDSVVSESAISNGNIDDGATNLILPNVIEEEPNENDRNFNSETNILDERSETVVIKQEPIEPNESDGTSTSKSEAVIRNDSNNENEVIPVTKIKTEPVTDDDIPAVATSSKIKSEEESPVKIKTEPSDTNDSTAGTSTSQGQNSAENKIKVELPDNNNPGGNTSNNRDKPSAAVAPIVINKQNGAGSSVRSSCKYGIKCYRRNPVHRIEEAHPGDVDYRRPDFPEPPVGTPLCPYGASCYRRNPVHFRQFSHPPQTDFNQNRLNRKKMLRNLPPVVYKQELSDDDTSSSDDFSISEDEFNPDESSQSDSDEGVDMNDNTESQNNIEL